MRATVRHSVVALVLAALASHAQAADIGTLFYSADQRAQMDRLRRGEPAAALAEAGTGAAPRKPTVTGYVQRSDGRNTVWIDGRPVVVASPAAKPLLDPRIVQPLPPEAGLRVEAADGDAGNGKGR